MSGVHVLIATPCHSGSVTEGYMRSLLALSHVFRDYGINMDMSILGGDSLITRARNGLAGFFILEKKFTHLLFIDDDLSFNPNTIMRMIASDLDVVGGCYPLKKYHMEKVMESAAKYTEPEDIWANSLTYAYTGLEDERGVTRLSVTDGFCEVRDVATGLMLITRNCVDKLMAAYPELYCGEESGLDIYNDIHPDIEKNFWLFFETSFDKTTKRYLSEDYHFCKLWRDIGEEVWMEVATPVVHSGIGHFRGDIKRTFTYQQQED
jgi:hypothetical protein|tara:strand:- start:22856 stop:23647 length:792 start_codon:yes stop_codon:yes gene_type:complete